MRYLIRKKKSRVAHIWLDKDTACRMYSTGGLNPRKYIESESTLGLPICQNCTHKIELAKQGKGFIAKYGNRKKHIQEIHTHPVGYRKSAAMTRGYLDASSGISLKDNFYRKINSSVTMCAYWDKGWQDYHRAKEASL